MTDTTLRPVAAPYEARAFLHDGTIVDIRSVVPSDRDELVRLHAERV